MNVGKRPVVIVDEARLRSDVLAYCHANGLVMSKQCVLNGMNDSVFSNMRTSYVRYKEEVDKVFDTTEYISVGRVTVDFYDKILEIFHLKDIYKVPRYGTPTDNTVKNDETTIANNSEIAEQLKNIELSINRLGNVMMQILEKMPKQSERPVAVLPRENKK